MRDFILQKLEETDRRSQHALETLEREQRHLHRQLALLQTHGEWERVRTDSLGSRMDSDRSESERGQSPIYFCGWGLSKVRSVFIVVFLCLSRGHWSWRGKHGVLPWRNGQCQHQRCQRPGRPEQPTELGQRRGLLHLQSKTGLFCLKHQPTVPLKLQPFKAFTF